MHHSNTENLKGVCEWASVEKCLDYGVLSEFLLIEAMCSYILFLNGLPVSPTYLLLFWSFRIINNSFH